MWQDKSCSNPQRSHSPTQSTCGGGRCLRVVPLLATTELQKNAIEKAAFQLHVFFPLCVIDVIEMAQGPQIGSRNIRCIRRPIRAFPYTKMRRFSVDQLREMSGMRLAKQIGLVKHLAPLPDRQPRPLLAEDTAAQCWLSLLASTRAHPPPMSCPNTASDCDWSTREDAADRCTAVT